MMSMYNMIMGYAPFAPMCIVIVGGKADEIPRFRDAWLADDGKSITILTRTGGGNRDSFLIENENMRQRPGYLDDIDDPFDGTYARFQYVVPEHLQADTRVIAEITLKVLGGAGARGPGASVEIVEGRTPVCQELTADDKTAIENSMTRLVLALGMKGEGHA